MGERVEREGEAVVKNFVAGLIDSLSVHKAIPVVVNCRPVANTFGLVLAANLGLLIGSITIFDRLIGPSLNYLAQTIETEADSSFAYSIYHIFWIAPVYLLCYLCSIFWYQDLAEDAFRYSKKHASRKIAMTTTVSNVIYSTIVWFAIYTQIHALVTIVPVVHRAIFVKTITGIETGIVGVIVAFSVHVSQLFGLCLLSAVCGWYAFDPSW